ncbi:hypothetical protein [Actinoplanes couchii]|uniref:DUF5666 domain-containing protein n=1 Tax=Actinoplanes couchii TaxID=403638 RepID=A0ABQ3XMS4_9ACTN|nr:hypothetical protein [Actinoplanes couchii]MDR6321605.1 hypothetical protein [Actinoplanes couchii]GID59700.1 hypothetical protein Aco03nite_081040 [Actinoplanes couchii]
MTSTDHETEVLPRSGTPPELTEELAAVAPRRWWNRTTIGLLGVALLIGGFLGGIAANRHWGTPTEAPVAAERMPGPAPGRGTTGTVKLVDGTTLYVQTEAGETVTVRTGDSTTVKLSQVVTLDKLLAGITVTVQGVADSEGIVTATAVTAG